MKLANVVTDGGDLFGYEFYCPGCRQRQIIPTEEAVAGNVVWRFINHDMQRPTFRPELRTHWGQGGRLVCCNALITDGRIEFLDDCTHELAGQTVEMPELDPT